MEHEAVIAANPRTLDAEAEYIAIEVPRLFRERLRAVLNLDDRRYPDEQGYPDSVPAMLETRIQDARLNFGLLNTLSGHHLGSTASSRITNQLESHAPDAANHARRSFKPDPSPSQPTPEPDLHRRHSLYAEHGNFQPNGGITTPIERKTCGKQFCLGGVCTSMERREERGARI
jgi:hypothetical protein